jgi:hypothetical protein
LSSQSKPIGPTTVSNIGTKPFDNSSGVKLWKHRIRSLRTTCENAFGAHSIETKVASELLSLSKSRGIFHVLVNCDTQLMHDGLTERPRQFVEHQRYLHEQQLALNGMERTSDEKDFDGKVMTTTTTSDTSKQKLTLPARLLLKLTNWDSFVCSNNDPSWSSGRFELFVFWFLHLSLIHLFIHSDKMLPTLKVQFLIENSDMKESFETTLGTWRRKFKLSTIDLKADECVQLAETLQRSNQCYPSAQRVPPATSNADLRCGYLRRLLNNCE